MKHNISKATAEFVKAKQALEEAEKIKAQAEVALKEAFDANGVDSFIVEGTKVTIVNAERASYDVEALADMVSAPLMKQVTKRSVDAKKFRAAVELGKITPEVADAVTTLTPYQSVRVTVAVEDAQVATVKKVKVA